LLFTGDDPKRPHPAWHAGGYRILDAKSGRLYPIIAAAHGRSPNHGLYDHVGVPVQVNGTLYSRVGNQALFVETVHQVK